MQSICAFCIKMHDNDSTCNYVSLFDRERESDVVYNYMLARYLWNENSLKLTSIHAVLDQCFKCQMCQMFGLCMHSVTPLVDTATYIAMY